MKAEDKSGPVRGKRYWFYIDTCCEIRSTENSLLIYNSLNGSLIEYLYDPGIWGIMRRLRSVRNMGVIPLHETDLRNPVISGFVEDMRREFMGDLIDSDFSDGKPIQIVPREKIMEGVENGKSLRSLKISGEKVMEYLFRISLHLTDRCSRNCRICGGAHQQFLWCTSGNGGHQELDGKKLDNLLQQLQGRSWMILDIIGGDPFSHSRFDEYITSMKEAPVKKTLYVHYLQAFAHLTPMTRLADGKLSCVVLVHFPAEVEKIRKTAKELQAADPHAEFHFLIESGDDFLVAEKIAESCSLRKTEFHPFYNGKNLDFFRENVYVNKDDISAARPSRKKIFANRLLNSLHFGKLMVLPDGKVRANIHGPVLGEIEKNLLREIVFRELTRGGTWRKTRRRAEPCKKCLYVDLCPPLSHYNAVIGRNDLCHMSNAASSLS